MKELPTGIDLGMGFALREPPRVADEGTKLVFCGWLRGALLEPSKPVTLLSGSTPRVHIDPSHGGVLLAPFVESAHGFIDLPMRFPSNVGIVSIKKTKAHVQVLVWVYEFLQRFCQLLDSWTSARSSDPFIGLRVAFLLDHEGQQVTDLTFRHGSIRFLPQTLAAFCLCLDAFLPAPNRLCKTSDIVLDEPI